MLRDHEGRIDMTRQQRAQELNELVKSEEGLTEIQEIYKRECERLGDEDTLPPHSLMIDAILQAEFPSHPPGFLAKT